jgi:hypothetical protein
MKTLLPFRRLALVLVALGLGLTLVPASAEAPRTPYQDLEERAQREGAGSVRAAYRALLERGFQDLERTADESLTASFRRLLLRSRLDAVLGSWARVEILEARAGRSTVSASSAVLGQVVGAFERVHLGGDELIADFERRCLAAEPDELRRLGIEGLPSASFATDREVARRRIALLAKQVRHREALSRLLSSPLDGCATADEFLALSHDLEAVLGKDVPTAPAANGGVP